MKIVSRSAVLQFAGHWKKALMGPVVGIILMISGQVSGRPLGWGWFFALIFAALAWQFYSELANSKKLDSLVPELYLEYNPSYSNFDFSGLFVRVQNDRTAFGMKLTSEIVVGENHCRLGMLWSILENQVGKERVSVQVRCLYYDDKDMPRPYGGLQGEQLKMFLDKKATKPEELIVTVNFRDVDGRQCPARRFRIFNHAHETTLDETIRCEPIQKLDN
jgi:hypothetical protein